MIEDIKLNTNQEIKLVSRKNLNVNGVIEVSEFDELCVILKTVCGDLSIEGRNIKISVP